MFFLGLWWENTNRQGARAGMTTGLLIWFTPIVNEVLPSYGLFAGAAGADGVIFPALAQWLPAIGSALVAVPIVFAVTIGVSFVTDEPPLETKQMVRQCHSPEPMGQQQTAEDVVGNDGSGGTPADD